MINPDEINLDSLAKMPLEYYRKFPNLACIYFAVKADRVLYIGKTINLKTRWSTHHHKKRLTEEKCVYIHFLPCHPIWQETIELRFIDYFEPPLNTGVRSDNLHSRLCPKCYSFQWGRMKWISAWVSLRKCRECDSEWKSVDTSLKCV